MLEVVTRFFFDVRFHRLGFLNFARVELLKKCLFKTLKLVIPCFCRSCGNKPASAENDLHRSPGHRKGRNKYDLVLQMLAEILQNKKMFLGYKNLNKVLHL